MLSKDLVKIKLVNMGYVPNYPYHLISDTEMCLGFLNCKAGSGYFFDAYPSDINPNLEYGYSQLLLSIQYYLCLIMYGAGKYEIPDWVYSYMLGATIGVQSDPRDIHDLIYPLGVDNVDDIFDAKAAKACWDTSLRWIQRTRETKFISIPPALKDTIEAYLRACPIYDTTLYDIYSYNHLPSGMYGAINERPATMFGEPHVVKQVRLDKSSFRGA